MTENTRRRWLRFSLRSLLIVVTLLCVVLGTWVHRSLRQRDAVAEARSFGKNNAPFYSFQVSDQYQITETDPPGPAWLRERLGIDFLASVTAFSMHEANDDQVRVLKDLPEICLLDLKGCHELTDAGLASLAKLPKLRRLVLWFPTANGEGFAALAARGNLQELVLFNGDKTTATTLVNIAKLTSLRKLQIDCGRQTDRGIAELATLPHLRELSLEFNEDFTDTSLESLQTLPCLDSLSLLYHEDLNGEGLKYLTGFRHLDCLNFEGELSDATLARLPELPGLKTIALTVCGQLTGESLADLARQPDLKTLFLGHLPRMNESGLQYLERLPRLTELIINGSGGPEFKLTDVGLKSIARAGSLRKLVLRRCNRLTDAGLAELAALEILDELTLEVDNLQQFSPAAIARLQSWFPKCRIVKHPHVYGF